MIVKAFNINGADRVVWDSDRGVVTYDVDGVTETGVTPFTAMEQEFVRLIMFETARDNRTILQDEAVGSITTMLTGIQQVQDFAAGTLVPDATINANPAQYMRLVAAELVEVEQNLIAVARLVAGQTESANTGA